MRTIRHPSVIPIYIAAAFWLVAALFLPMTALWQYILYAVVSAAIYFISTRFFPGTVETLPEPERAPNSGDADVDALISGGRKKQKELLAERETINDPAVRAHTQTLAALTEKILAALEEDPSRAGRTRKFFSYYLPTTCSLVQRYQELEVQGIAGENITHAKQSIAEMLTTAEGAFRRQLDGLYEADALDISADIQVMKQMMAAEGLLTEDTFSPKR